MEVRGIVKKYSKKEILEQLKQHYLKNPKMTMKSFAKDKSVCSPKIIINRFGSWNKGLLEAGIKIKLTKEKIIEQLKDHYSRNSSMTSTNFDEDKSVCSYMVVIRRFGSWKEALKEAEIPLRENLTREKIIEHLIEHYKRNPKMTSKSFDEDRSVCSVRSVKNMFGSWNKGLLRAGIYIREEEKLTKEKIIKHLKKFHSKNGKITVEEFEVDKDFCSVVSVQRIFGSWNKGLIEAGLREENYVEYEKEKLLLILKEKVKTGELNYEGDIDAIKGVPSAHYVRKLWSWRELSKKLGLKRTVKEYTDEEIYEAYEKVKKKYKVVSLPIMQKETGIGYGVFKNHYGGWNNFLIMLNESIHEHVEITQTDEELIKMYRDFSIKIGKEKYGAEKKDIDEKGFIYSSASLAFRFTGMTNLRRLAGFEIKWARPCVYSKELLKEILHIEYMKRSKKMLIREIEKNPELPSIGTFFKHFQTSSMNKIWEEVLGR